MKNALFLLSAVSLAVSASTSPLVYDQHSHQVMDGQGRIIELPESAGAPMIVRRDGNGDHAQSPLRIELAEHGVQRYLVELEDEPLFVAKTRLIKSATSQQTRANAVSVKANASQQIERAVISHQRQLQAKQANLWANIKGQGLASKLVRQHQKLSNMLVIEASADDVQKIRRQPGVKQVTAAKLYQKSLAESVPLVGAPSVWQLTDGNNQPVRGTGIDVAVVDTGIDYTHPALGGCLGEGCKVVDGWDFVNNDADPMDGEGHGTHVAGIIAAESAQYTGVAPGVRLHAYKVLSDEGWGFDTDIIAALEHAIDPDGDPLTDDAVDVVNMSLGGGGSADDPLSRATDALVDAGIIAVVAAGNGGRYGDIASTSPASAAKAITVASSTKSDTMSSFSSKGALGQALKPEITAPGSDILSTGLGHTDMTLSGTSMAAPHVAGAAALLRQLFPERSVDEIKGMLMATTVDIGEDPMAQGMGRMDIAAAVEAKLIAPQGMLSFGRIDNSQVTWQASAELTLTNLSDEALELSLILPTNLPEGMALSVSETQLQIAAGASISIPATLTVADTSAIPFAQNGAMLHFDDLRIEAENLMLRVPVVVEKSIKLRLSHNYPQGVTVSVHTEDWSYSTYSYLYEGEDAEMNVPGETLFFTLDSSRVTPADIAAPGLPEDASILAYTRYMQQLNDDAELFFDVNDITTFYGVQSVRDEQGQVLPESRLVRDITVAGLDSPQNSILVIGYGFKKLFFATNTLDDETQVNFLQPVRLLDEDGQALPQVYHVAYRSSAQNKDSVFFNLDMATDPVLTVNTFDGLLDDEARLIFGSFDENGSGMTDIIDHPAHQLSIRFPAQHTSHGKVMAAPGHMTEQGWPQGSMSTGMMKLVVDEQPKIQKYSFNSGLEVEIPSSELALKPASTFWHAGLYTYDNQLSFESDYDPSIRAFVRDSLFNHHDLSAHSQLKWLCDDQVIQSDAIVAEQQATLLVPEMTCERAEMVIEFDNYLDDALFRSQLVVSADNPDGLYLAKLSSVTLWEGDNLVVDQAVNKIDAALVVKTDYGIADTLSAEIKIGDTPWQPLAGESDVDGRQFKAFLPMLEGNHLVALRLRYGYGEQAVQTLNGFMRIGTEAGEDRDVDDDGISNDQDSDNDNDGFEDLVDAFPYNPREWLDTDGDGIGNNADSDDDNDGVSDAEDAFPLDPTESVDTDGDGIGNNADSDDDNDGVSDAEDAFPLDPTESVDTDGDGIGNNADSDDDNDGVSDAQDAYPLDATRSSNSSGTADSSGGGGSMNLVWLALLGLACGLRRRTTM